MSLEAGEVSPGLAGSPGWLAKPDGFVPLPKFPHSGSGLGSENPLFSLLPRAADALIPVVPEHVLRASGMVMEESCQNSP